MREIDPRAVHHGLEFVHEGRKLRVVEHAFTGRGNLLIRAREVWASGDLGEPELIDLGKPDVLHCP
jgi:hypothetical protein